MIITHSNHRKSPAHIEEIGMFNVNGYDREGFSVTLPDGTKLRVLVEVKLPPAIELTPRPTQKFDRLTGMMIDGNDGGFMEAVELCEMSQAVTLLRRLEEVTEDYLAG